MPSSSQVVWSFLVDEDMPRSTAPALRGAGYRAEDVRDVGLQGQPDAAVYAYAQAHQQIILSADLGFANIVRFPLGSHAGIVVVRLPNTMPTSQVNQVILARLSALAGQDLTGALVIIDPRRVRIRRSP